MSEGIANVEFPATDSEPDWAVSPYDAYQDTLVVWLMSKYPGVFGRFARACEAHYVAVSSRRISDEGLKELTLL